ncbi:MAG: outer membrane beta-barrel protein [Bacteroidaceae bacterium]|nr:outer membrane beta-barrel protein [Bacteroidaceae bacterium]
MKRHFKPFFIASLLISLSTSFTMHAQSVEIASQGWYVGVQAGMPMAEADFSSFGADKFRPGWSTGIHAGYRFTQVWSAEFTANWGQQFLSEQACCYERGYTLGADMRRYRYNIPTGLDTYLYKDLLSRTFVQRYGLQANMNVLGFFKYIADGRWHLELSPAVYAANTCSALMFKADKTLVMKNLNKWHVGFGCNGQLSYALSSNLNLAIYGGFTHFTGRTLDGIPKLHSTNYIIDAGLKFNYFFTPKR